MPAVQHRYGDCLVVVQARMIGDQPARVQRVTAVASRTGREHLSMTVSRVLLYLEDRAALDAFGAAVRRAQALADGVFGPVEDGFTRAEARDRAVIAKRSGAAAVSRIWRVAPPRRPAFFTGVHILAAATWMADGPRKPERNGQLKARVLIDAGTTCCRGCSTARSTLQPARAGVDDAGRVGRLLPALRRRVRRAVISPGRS